MPPVSTIRPLSEGERVLLREPLPKLFGCRTLFLSGHYLYKPADEDGFPWATCEVVRVPVGGWVLRLVRHGPSVTPSHTRPPFSDAQPDAGTVPVDGTISLRDFEALKAPDG